MMHARTAGGILLLLLGSILYAGPCKAQDSSPGAASPQQMRFSTDAVGPNRFVAVHGQRSVIMGYPRDGLEIWGYPLQILSRYRVGFRPEGTTAEVDAQLLLRRIDYDFDSITRTYIGPDYLVREKLFVPLDQPAAALRYSVEGSRRVDIVVHCLPVLNLMWPGAIGGQYSRWNPDGPGFVVAEPERGFSAMIGSAEIVSHEDTVNSTLPAASGLSFAMHPRAPSTSGSGTPAQATVLVVLNAANTREPAAAFHTLSTNLRRLEVEAAAHWISLASSSFRVHTPDEAVNRSLAWAVAALDQAWVCNPMLGCGLVAGYGPSRDARRPQYAWFFAGDGLVGTNALISAGEYTRAREELAFIVKYQDGKTGMIWHELSQSAGYIDWTKYPYMYVHVDISFDYLATVARYVAAAGDAKFAQEHWSSIASAYRYCHSLIGSSDHLPHIPEDKEASDEQHRPADDLGLSAAWMAAASGYAELAQRAGHREEIEPARNEVQLTRASIAKRYWNQEENFWLDGHTHAGEPIFRHAMGPTNLVLQKVFTPQQNEAVLEQLTSSDFQADWGSREVARTAKDYDPYSYGAGSVSALGTTAAATTLWQAHRPESAFAMWSAVMQWNTLDSPGHLHEVLAGNFFHEQTESVPEQTWSSAGLVDATVRGLLGLEIDGGGNRLRFAPHLPAEWKQISVENVRLPHSLLSWTMKHDAGGVDVSFQNDGVPTTISFEPQIPLGAHGLRAEFGNHSIPADVEQSASDEHAHLTLSLPSGGSRCHLSFIGGVSVSIVPAVLRVGDPSSGLKLISLDLHGDVLSISADVHPSGTATLLVVTPREILTRPGLEVRPLSDGKYLVDISPQQQRPFPGETLGYARIHASISFRAEGQGGNAAPRPRNIRRKENSAQPTSTFPQ